MEDTQSGDTVRGRIQEDKLGKSLGNSFEERDVGLKGVQNGQTPVSTSGQL